MCRSVATNEATHNSGDETTGTITTFEGKVPSRCRRKIDAAPSTSPRKMAIPTGRNFASCYLELCKQQRLRPLPVICVTLPHSLDFTTDRIKMDDWGPILNSLSLDRSLKSISVHSRYQCRKPLEEVNSEDKARAMGKTPVVLTRYLLEWLSQSVGQCLRNSPSLTQLELEGIPFPPDCIAVLCVGLSGTETLHHLSLRRCYIGDTGCELICRTIADIRSVRSLNLSHCDLTSNSGSVLASALSRQKLALYHDTWKQSLRYREPNFETMPGLRRLTLNDNPHLGNFAAREVIEAIRDSLWMKALDLQHCGLTDQIGIDLLNLLEQNNTLAVLDVRKNANLNDELAAEVMRRLEENDVDGKSEYKWMGLVSKDKRTISAGVQRDNENENAAKTSRPRSAFATRRPPQAIPPRRTLPISILPANMKVRPPSPPVRDTQPLQRSVIRSRAIESVRSTPKVSLHLDLQSRIQSTMNRASRDIENQPEHKNTVQCSEETSSRKSFDSSKVNVSMQSMDRRQNDVEKTQDILQQLIEARAEYDRLLQETKRTDLLLMEERACREAAETNLRSAQNDMAEMESALKLKENETRGYLLVSQQSLDEICLSFERLLELLERVAANHPSVRTQDSRQIASADIKRRLASVIRHTKSENLKRGYKVNIDLPKTHVVNSARKLVKSESDVRSAQPISATHLEKKIGECPDNNELCKKHYNADKPLSPGDRARAIFASIVSGEAVLEFY